MYHGQGAQGHTRWEHEHVLDEVQKRLDEHPEKMHQRRETVEHPFGTIKCWMGYTHFQMKTLQHVRTEMALPGRAIPRWPEKGVACTGLQSQAGHEDHG